MTKKIIQITLIIAGLVVIGYVYYQFSSGEKKIASSWDSVPANASILLEINQFNELSEYSVLLNQLASNKNEMGDISFNPMTEWTSVIRSIDSLRSKSEPWYSLLAVNSVILSSAEQARGDAWIMCVGLDKSKSDSQARELMTIWGAETQSREFKKTTIHELADVQYAVLNDCLVIASTGSLIEDAIIRNQKNDLLKYDQTFMAAHEVISKDIPLHLYTAMGGGDWLQLDPSFIAQKSTLSGYAILKDSSDHSFSATRPGKDFHVQEVLPSITSILDVYSYADFTSGWTASEEFFAGKPSSAFWNKAWKDFGDTCQCDINEAMLSWRSGEWGSAIIAINDSATTEVRFYGMKDSVDVIQMMRPVLFEQNINASGIYKIRYPELFDRNHIQGVLVEANYIRQINEYIFVAATPSELLSINQAGERLANNATFQKAMLGVNSTTGRFIYQTDYYASSLPSSLMRIFNGSEFISASVEHFKDNKYLVNIMLPIESAKGSSGDEGNNQTEPIAATAADVEAIRGPWKVTNHNTGKKETLLQNKSLELCLIDESNSMLWKKKLNSEIIGEVSQIDALKNGKLQMVFTTVKGLFVLDRNGNDLSGFPVMTGNDITSGVCVADYDQNKKYRLLLSQGDGAILNYGIDGQMTTGWKYQNNNTITTNINTFRVGSEDFIIAISTTGKMQLLKRTGEIKYTSTKELTDYNNKAFGITPGTTIENTKITYTTKTGDEKTISLGK